MPIPVEMPKMSDTMEEGVLVAWLADEGDEVAAGDVIAQVETDKATMDLEVYDDGVLLKKMIGEGDAVPIGALIAVLGKKGEDIAPILKKYGKEDSGASAPSKAEKEPQAAPASGGDGARSEGEPSAEAPAAEEAPAAAEAPAGTEGGERGEEVHAVAEVGNGAERRPAADGVGAAEVEEADGRVKSSPLARRLAKEHGIDLGRVQGTGPEGRIVKRDIEAALTETAAAPAAAPAAPSAPGPRPAIAPEPAYQLPEQVMPGAPEDLYEVERISQMRKTIARRLAQSKFTAPHFYLTSDVDMEKAVTFRSQLNGLAEAQGRPKISFNDLVTKACALALRQHPQVNSSYLEQEGEIRHYRQIHVAVAVAIDEGLVTPVIRNADQKGLGQLAEETRSLAERARERKLQPPDWEGSTFTTSNLGMFGIEEFTAIINPPNACILAIGAIRDVPVVKDGAVVPGKRMKLTLSCDHRIVDGATGAQFLATVQQYLEEPLNLLL